jgi:hypothetical protein
MPSKRQGSASRAWKDRMLSRRKTHGFVSHKTRRAQGKQARKARIGFSRTQGLSIEQVNCAAKYAYPFCWTAEAARIAWGGGGSVYHCALCKQWHIRTVAPRSHRHE